MRADEAKQKFRVCVLQSLGNLHVIAKRRRAGVQHGQLVVGGHWQDIVERQSPRGRIDQTAAGHQRRGLGEPSRIPKRTNLALRLVTRSRASIEAFERWRVEEKVLKFLCDPVSLAPRKSVWSVA